MTQQLLSTAYTVERRSDGWWFADEAGEDIGPYRTHREAQGEIRGVKRFYRHANRRGYITTEKKKR